MRFFLRFFIRDLFLVLIDMPRNYLKFCMSKSVRITSRIFNFEILSRHLSCGQKKLSNEKKQRLEIIWHCPFQTWFRNTLWRNNTNNNDIYTVKSYLFAIRGAAGTELVRSDFPTPETSGSALPLSASYFNRLFTAQLHYFYLKKHM
jgi:hypothetical protein